MKAIFTILFFFILLNLSAQPKKYYWDAVTGDDTRSSVQAQNQATPWKTVGRINSFNTSMVAGDTCFFQGGQSFYGAVTLTKGGLSGQPIVFASYGTGKATITGLSAISSWSNLGSNIWETPSSVSGLSSCNMVVINGINTQIGRWPNASAANGGYRTITGAPGGGANSLQDSGLPGSPTYVGGDCIIRKNHFVIDKCPITGQSGTTINFSNPSGYPAVVGFGYFVQNHPATLDVQTEWYFNPSNGKLRMFSSSSPTNVSLVTIDQLITITNCANITFYNIKIEGSNTTTLRYSNADNIFLTNTDVNYSGYYCVFPSGGSTGNRMTNTTVTNTGNSTWFDPFNTNNTGTYIGHCDINKTGLFAGSIAGAGDGYGFNLGINGSGATIEYTNIDSSGYLGLYFADNSTVQNNFINHFCIQKDDGAGIYTGNAGTGKIIRNNIVVNGVGAPQGTDDLIAGAIGIYVDDLGQNVQIYGNTSANNARAGVLLHNTNFIDIHDNTFYNNGEMQGYFTSHNIGTMHDITMLRNIFFSRVKSPSNSTQFCATYDNGVTGFSQWGTFNFNVYARPISQAAFYIHTQESGYSIDNEFNLAQFQAAYGQDLNSTISPKTVTTLNDILFYYNETSVNKTISLPGTYIDVYSTVYAGAVTLLPYTSVVLIFQSSSGPLPLGITATATTISCNGNLATITAQATGGVTPYSYQLDVGSGQASNVFNSVSAGTHTVKVTDQQNSIANVNITITQPAALTLTESHTAITVNGNNSTVTLSGGGGTGAKQYKIGSGAYQSSAVFTLAAGTYTATVRDANNCTTTLTFTITQPSVLVVGSSVTTAITCNAGTGVITVTASGGTAPYTNTGAFTRAAGTWSFTVTDAGGASATTTTTITQPTAITISESHTAIAINGGTSTVTITASGGTGTLSYKGSCCSTFQSSNVFTGIFAGTYTVIVRDASLCTNTITFTITQPSVLAVSAAVTTAIACNNGTGTATVNASGGTTPYLYKVGSGSYQASSIFSGLLAGTYTFTVLDAGGAIVSSTPLTITQPTAITVSSAYGTAPATVTVTSGGGVGTLNYRIDIGSYQASNVFTGVSAGNHIITVRDANLCTATQTINVPSAGTPLGISATPTNPTCNGGNGSVTVSGSGGTPPYTGTGVFAIAVGTWSFTVTDNVGATASTSVTITQPAPISIAPPSYAAISSNGGSTTVTITPSGGVPAYTYNLDAGGYQGSNSFAGVLAGNHSITVKDANNCTSTLLFAITEPGLLYITATPTSITCYGGNSTVTISGSGGTAPITIVGGSPQTKTAGTYTFSVTDAFGTQKDTIITISQPSQISISVTTGTIVTNGGNTTVTATASGGTGALSYKIDAGSYQGTGSFSGITAGTHTVTVRDASLCTNTNTFSITQPGSLYITVSPTAITCNGGNSTVTITGSGGTAPLTITGGSPQTKAAGTYTFRVTDAFGAIHDSIVTISQPSLIVINQITNRPGITIFGGLDSIFVNASGGTGSLQYKLDGGSYQTADSFANVTGGNHIMYVKDASACVVSQGFTLAQPASSPAGSYRKNKKKRPFKYRNG